MLTDVELVRRLIGLARERGPGWWVGIWQDTGELAVCSPMSDQLTQTSVPGVVSVTTNQPTTEAVLSRMRDLRRWGLIE